MRQILLSSVLAVACVGVAAVAGCADSQSKAPATQQLVPPKANAQMQAVLDALTELGGKPIETLSAEEARKQPTPTDAVKVVAAKKGITLPAPGVKTMERTITNAGQTVKVRVYDRENSTEQNRPVVVYVHGGGWVIATLDTYDAAPRALVRDLNAVVVSVDYRQAPENKFPAAHEDVYNVLQWAMSNAQEIYGDPAKVAILGESAGGNMAVAIPLMSKMRGGKLPVGIVAVYPVASVDMSTPSYLRNANAKPLSMPMMQWFADKTFKTPADGKDPRISLVNADLAGLPPVTIINAEIDPLKSDGDNLAKALKDAGVKVEHKVYPGVTHEFYGMDAVVAEAKDAQKFAAEQLKKDFK